VLRLVDGALHQEMALDEEPDDPTSPMLH
jgi:hypothetical protein